MIKYIVLDCRPLSHFENGRLPCAIHLSPELLDDPEEMVTVLNGFQAMKGCHFCLLGPGTVPVSDYPPAKGSVVRSVETKVNEKDELEEKQTAYQDDPSSLFLLCLLQKGFDHVSRYAVCTVPSSLNNALSSPQVQRWVCRMSSVNRRCRNRVSRSQCCHVRGLCTGLPPLQEAGRVSALRFPGRQHCVCTRIGGLRLAEQVARA